MKDSIEDTLDAALAIARYSDSVLDPETLCCFEEDESYVWHIGLKGKIQKVSYST